MTDNQYDLTILNKEVKNGGLFFGAKTVIKEVKKGNISKIYLANDLIDSIKNEIEKSTKEIIRIKTDLDKEHLKEVCKKPFNVSVLGIQKGREASKGQESSEEKEDSRKEIRAKKDKVNKAKKELEEHEEKIEERRKSSDKNEKAEKKDKEKIDKVKKEEKKK